MKLITRDTDYAIRAIAYIAGKEGDIVTVTELIAKLNAPKPFLRKALQRLNKGRIVRSNKGRGGGFSLARSPKRIRIMDIIEIFQGPFLINECFFRKQICPNRKRCLLKKKIDIIGAHVAKELKAITIGDLLKG